jgi:hypothetical protein
VDPDDDVQLGAKPGEAAMLAAYRSRLGRLSATATMEASPDPMDGTVKLTVEANAFGISETALANFLRLRGMRGWSDIERLSDVSKLRVVADLLEYAGLAA